MRRWTYERTMSEADVLGNIFLTYDKWNNSENYCFNSAVNFGPKPFFLVNIVGLSYYENCLIIDDEIFNFEPGTTIVSRL